MSRRLVLILALAFALGWTPAARAADPAAPAHLREIPEIKELATEVVRAMEKHEFESAAAALERARAHARAHGARGALVSLELDAVESMLVNERRDERRAQELATGAFAAIAREYGEPVALRSAAALPFVQTFLMQANFTDGLALLDRAFAAIRAAWGDDAEELADAEHLRGGFEYYANEFALAEASYLRAAERSRRSEGERSREALASRAQAALMKTRQGDPQGAIAILRALLEELPDDPKLKARSRALVQRNLGQALDDAGRPDEMIRNTEQVWIVLRDALGEDDAETLESLHGLAANLGALGRHADALALQQMVLPTFRRLYGDVSEMVVLTLNNMGFNLAALGDAPASVTALRECLAVSIELFGPEHPDTTRAMQALGVALMQDGKAEEALPLLAEADRRSANAPAPVRTRARSNLYLAQATLRATPLERGRLVVHVHATARELGAKSPYTVQVAARAAELLARQGATAQSLALHELALRGVEAQLAGQQWLPNNRRAFLARYLNLYRTAATLNAQVAGDCTRALRLAESVRGHGLLESVTRQRALEASEVPETERVRLIELVGRRERLESEAARTEPGTTDRVRRDGAASAAAVAVAEMEGALARQYPRFARLRAALGFDLAASRARLSPDEAFVEFVVAPAETMAIVVSRSERPTCFALGTSAEIVAAAIEFRRLMEAGAAAPALRAPLQTLSRRLFAPVWTKIGRAARLVVSPDGPLAALPLELLPAPGSTDPLVATREVTYAQSLAVLAAIRTRFAASGAERWRRDVLAFGGPRYGDAPAPASGVAALVSSRGTAARGALLDRARSASDASEPAAAFHALGRVWSPLPGAEREARAVAGLFRQSLAVTGAQATEQRLQQLSASGDLAEFRYLHFATHGYLSTDIPSLSAIVLSLPGTAAADGYVTAAEWPGYRLRSQLVVLSGCETGLGAEGAGDGVLGLPYALFIAGNRNTLMSLWPIADDATTAFMVDFFGRLRAGQPQASALAQTKRRFIGHARFAHPRHWAAFVLYGG